MTYLFPCYTDINQGGTDDDDGEEVPSQAQRQSDPPEMNNQEEEKKEGKTSDQGWMPDKICLPYHVFSYSEENMIGDVLVVLVSLPGGTTVESIISCRVDRSLKKINIRFALPAFLQVSEYLSVAQYGTNCALFYPAHHPRTLVMRGRYVC